MLENHNPYVALYQNTGQQINANPTAELSIRLVAVRNRDSCQYNTPTTIDEVGGIMVVDNSDDTEPNRDIVVKNNVGPLQRVCALHPVTCRCNMYFSFLMAMTVGVLIYPFKDSIGMDMVFEWIMRERSNSRRVTQLQYYAHLFHIRNPMNHIFYAGRLLHQFIVDAYACVEQNRLHYIRTRKESCIVICTLDFKMH